MDSQRIRRLQWLCRRGMKELDVLLQRFVAAEQTRLAAGAWPELEVLLAAEDDRLWDFLQHTDHPAAIRFRPLLECIRHGADDRH